MRKEEPSNNVKLAATNALLNSLEFTKANFDKEVSRMVPNLNRKGLDPRSVMRHHAPRWVLMHNYVTAETWIHLCQSGAFLLWCGNAVEISRGSSVGKEAPLRFFGMSLNVTVEFSLLDALLPNQTPLCNAAGRGQAWLSTFFQVLWQPSRFNFPLENCWGRKAWESSKRASKRDPVQNQRTYWFFFSFSVWVCPPGLSRGSVGKEELILNLQCRSSCNGNFPRSTGVDGDQAESVRIWAGRCTIHPAHISVRSPL